MFTGIIETIGRVVLQTSSAGNSQFWIESAISDDLKVDQSVSHQGVCLTVDELAPGRHRVTAIAETLQKTTLNSWKQGHLINLERCLPINGRLDGHFVQGHVDGTGRCISKVDRDGSWEFRFQFPEEKAALVIEKGSIAINGVSLTCFQVDRNEFTVAIIPYTLEHTQFQHLAVGDTVNLEFDIIGKYINRQLQVNSPFNTK